MFWGFSPALNLLDEIELRPETREVNVLLVGSEDARHILKTIAKCHQYEKLRFNFYVAERFLEQIGRQILLLNVALEQDSQLGLFEKTRIFMELFGNTKIRPIVSKYLTKKSMQLVTVVTDAAYGNNMMPVFNLQKLKFGERDYIENIFKFWSKKTSEFDIVNAWDRRLRNSLGVRYDARNGVFDWDYHMRLSDVGGDKIFSREYINWRSTGVAFTWLETDGSLPNPTFAAGILRNGEKLLHHGYLGDIEVGPFLAFGLDYHDETVWTKVNGQYKKRATDITEMNLVDIFYELATKTQHRGRHSRIGADLGCVVTAISDSNIDLYEGCVRNNYSIDDMLPLISTDNVSIIFLPFSLLSVIHHKTMFNSFFDVLYFSHHTIHKLNKDVLTAAKDNARLIIESKKFMINLKKDQIKDYANELLQIQEQCGFKNVVDFDPMHDSFAKYSVTES